MTPKTLRVSIADTGRKASSWSSPESTTKSPQPRDYLEEYMGTKYVLLQRQPPVLHEHVVTDG